jgi:thioredoxin 1
MHKLNNTEEFDQFVGSDQLTVVDFYAEWCGPCKMMAPMLESVAEEELPIGKVDIDTCADVAKNFNISSIPTLLFFRSGTVVGKMVGSQTKASLMKKVEELA